MKHALSSNVKHPEHCSSKSCCCGGHSQRARKRFKTWKTGKDRRAQKDGVTWVRERVPQCICEAGSVPQ